MSHRNKTDEIAELKARQEQLQEAKKNQEKESRKAKFPNLIQLAMAAMKCNREKTWNTKHGGADPAKLSELTKKVRESGKAFLKAFRQIVHNDLKRWWGAELQKAYIQGAPEALLVFYLSDDPNKTKPLAYALKNAADEYIQGWALLGKKKREELPGPIDKVGNGSLAVQILIEQLKNGDDIQKLQAQILEKVFEDPIDALGQKNPEPTGFTLGETLGVQDQEGSAK